MPYEIEKNQTGTFSVYNKDTRRRLSKGTTKAKAEKQIKAVYMHGGSKGMKPGHKLRFHVALLKDRSVKNPLHRKILDFSKEVLKGEEMRGGEWYDDLWSGIKDVLAFPSQLINEIPYVKEGIEAVFPEVAPILEIAPKVAKYIYGDDTNVWLSDMLSDMPLVGDIREDKTYKTSNDLGETNWFSKQESDQQIDQRELDREQRELDRQYQEIYGEEATQRLADTVEYIDQITPQQSDTPYEPYAVPTYNPVRYSSTGEVIPTDDSIRFPMIYNYSNTDQPKNLQDHLLALGVSGKNFARSEFANVVKNQQPYAFLDFPLNGGGIRKISYTKTCA